jgi:hypothetical protein
MASLRFKRFTKVPTLKKIGRQFLGMFLDRFEDDLAEKQVQLPAATLDDDEYFAHLAGVFMAPEALPDNLNETLYAIDEMATPEGMERLEKAVEETQLDLNFDDESTEADVALQVWLNNPQLLARKHNEQKLQRLSSFEYYQAERIPDPSQKFTMPDAATIEGLRGALDIWFSQHNRGKNTTLIETYEMDGEFWFMIRHGDPLARTPKIEENKTEVLHFRPEKDDVVVYNPTLGEIRINARTKGEKDLYQAKFGFYLFGNENHFPGDAKYTLEPLRTDGKDALNVDDIDGIDEILMREIEFYWGGDQNEVEIRRADDIFTMWETRVPPRKMPEKARVNRVAFHIYFTGATKPRNVQIRPSNILKLGRHCDAALIEKWLAKRGFIQPRPQEGQGAA